jgi:hypothetical protein
VHAAWSGNMVFPGLPHAYLQLRVLRERSRPFRGLWQTQFFPVTLRLPERRSPVRGLGPTSGGRVQIGWLRGISRSVPFSQQLWAQLRPSARPPCPALPFPPRLDAAAHNTPLSAPPRRQTCV